MSSVRDAAALAPPAIRAPLAELDAAQRQALRQKFPNVHVQAVAVVETARGTEKLALVWKRKPSVERDCPRDLVKWNAYVEQSCTGFAGNLAGEALIARFRVDEAFEYLALSSFFGHDANPSGTGGGQKHSAFVPVDFAFEFLDVNGDGYVTEFLYHVGNAPYAMIGHWVAIGVFDDKLRTLEAQRETGSANHGLTGALVATPEAWTSLALTGRGQYELYCGARCTNTAQRWMLERTVGHRVTERTAWTCDPNDEASWKPGPPQHLEACMRAP